MKRTNDFDLHRFEKFISEDSASPLFARYANELINNKLFDKAIEICYKGISSHRFYISGYIILAKALISVNRIAEAKMVLEQALKLSPLCPTLKKLNEFLTNYSPIEKVTTDESKVVDKTEVSSTIDDKKETDNSLEEILSKFQSAESLLIRANPDYQPKEVPKEANEEIITETMANIYINQGLYDKAIEIFKKLSQKSPAKSVYYEGRILSLNQKLKSS